MRLDDFVLLLSENLFVYFFVFMGVLCTANLTLPLTLKKY